jgi:hypothetical protein
MNNRIASITAAACAVLCAGLVTAYAASLGTPGAPAGIGLGAGSALWLEGKSNLHEFESRTTQVAVTFTCDSSARSPVDVAGLEQFVRTSAVRGLDLSVPVTSLHSGKAGLDKNLWQDLRAEKFPAIQFHLEHYTLAPRGHKADTLDVRAEGMLSVAGHQRSLSLAARAYRSDQGMWLDGSQDLRMTEFGIKPRTMMLGALRVDDRITIRYHLLLAPAGPAVSTRAGTN